MQYDKDLQILNLPVGDYAAPGVEIVHPDAKALMKMETFLASERIEYKFVSGSGADRIRFKRISWPRLNWVLYMAGLMTLTDKPLSKVEGEA